MNSYGIDLKIGEALKQPEYRSVYKVDVRYMHGDADAYSNEGGYYKAGDPRLDHALVGLACMCSNTYRYMFDSERERKMLQDRFKEVGLDEDALDSFRDSYVQHDTTDQSYSNYARVEDVTVTFFDENGIEHEVDVSVDGGSIL